ncbi:MAG: GNAT family N-acetyltransferase [Oscillospiraceae bacterium]|nr:GNAT family N-acetyltransferase [Oscillospiraceae bacterium]
MKLQAKMMKLKDGRTAIIRQAVPDDAEQMLTMAKLCATETRNLCSTPEEYDFPVEAEMKWIIDQNGAGSLLQVAEVGGRLVGNCILHPQGGRRRVRHRCGIGLSIVKEFWANGIGTIFMQNAISVAKDIGYEQMELEVVSTNERAIGLYEKMGFVPFGLQPNMFKYEDGSYADVVLMALDLR